MARRMGTPVAPQLPPSTQGSPRSSWGCIGPAVLPAAELPVPPGPSVAVDAHRGESDGDSART